MRPLAFLATALTLAACGGGGGDERLTVYAAASLADVLPRIDRTSRYSFAGSDELAAQIRAGAPADVFVSASTRHPAELHAERLAQAPVVFATNRIIALVARGHRGGLASLAEPGVKVVVAAEGVPAGDYTRELLRRLGAEDVLANVVSEEQDVRGVFAKVALGEADAGFIYATDALTVRGRLPLRVIEAPERVQPRIEYAVAVVRESGRAARFVRRLLGRDGQAVLREAGFGPP